MEGGASQRRLGGAQELVANALATTAHTVCLDPGCGGAPRNVSALLADALPPAAVQGEGELRRLSLLSLRSLAIELGASRPAVEAARDSEDPPPKEAVLALVLERQQALAAQRQQALEAAEAEAERGDPLTHPLTELRAAS